MFKNKFVATRGFGKTGLQLFHMLEQLKAISETEQERLHFEKMQEEWSEFCIELTLRSLR